MEQAPNGHGDAPVLFFLEDPPHLDAAPEDSESGAGISRLAAAGPARREARQAEWEERRRVARLGVDGLTPAHAALLVARQARAQAGGGGGAGGAGRGRGA